MSVTPLHYDPEYPPARPPARRGPEAVLALADDYWRLAQRVAATEFVPKALRNRPEAVVAALLSGAERGLGPMESLRSIHVIEGTPSLSAEAKRALVLAAGHDFTIVESTATRCTVMGRRAGTDTTTSFTWTMDRARRARLVSKDNWVKYPESMLLARATSELCNAVFPDITAGLATTEEVTDEIAVAETSTTARRAPARRQPAPVAPAAAPNELAAGTPAVPAAGPTPPAPADSTEHGDLDALLEDDEPPPERRPHDPDVAKQVHAYVGKAFPKIPAKTRDRWRHALCILVTRNRDDGPAASSSDLDLEEQLALSNLLTRVMAGDTTVADGPDDTIEVRADGRTASITIDPPTVTISGAAAGTPDNPSAAAPDTTDDLEEDR